MIYIFFWVFIIILYIKNENNKNAKIISNIDSLSNDSDLSKTIDAGFIVAGLNAIILIL